LRFLEIVAVALVLQVLFRPDFRLAIGEVDTHRFLAVDANKADMIVDALLLGQYEIFVGKVAAMAAVGLFQIGSDFVVLRQITQIGKDGIHFLPDALRRELDHPFLFRLAQV
jgi:hypothetical protein